MKKVFEFKQESTAKEFAKTISETYGKEAVSEGTSVTIKTESPKAPESSEANMDEVRSMMSRMYDYMQEDIDIMQRYIYRLEGEMYDMFYEHTKGHLPPIKDAGKMQEALRAIGLGESFEVRKPTVTLARVNGVDSYQVK